MKCVSLICGECGKEFEKPRNEYNRRVRLGAEKLYCSLSCSSVNGNRVSPRKGDIKNFGDKRRRLIKNDLSPFRWYIRRVWTRAKKKNYITDLTLEYLKGLWENQKGLCPFSGQKLILPEGSDTWSEDNPFSPYSASLDRIDNIKGYIIGNVRFVAVMANYARNTFTDEEVIKFSKEVAEHNKSI